MNIFRLEMRIIRKSLLIWTITMSGLTFLMLALYPSMRTEQMLGISEAMLGGIDSSLMAAFGVSDMQIFTVFTHFLGYVFQYVTIAMMIFVTQKAMSMLIREETFGTIEFLYGRPVSRTDIFISKLAATAAAYILFLAAVCVSVAAGYIVFSEYEFSRIIRETLAIFGGNLYVGLIYMSVGTLLSVLIKSVNGAAALTIALVLGSYLLGIVAILLKDLDWLFYLSPMDWIKTGGLLSDGISAGEWAAGCSTIAVSLSAALVIYRRKNMRI